MVYQAQLLLQVDQPQSLPRFELGNTDITRCTVTDQAEPDRRWSRNLLFVAQTVSLQRLTDIQPISERVLRYKTRRQASARGGN